MELLYTFQVFFESIPILHWQSKYKAFPGNITALILAGSISLLPTHC